MGASPKRRSSDVLVQVEPADEASSLSGAPKKEAAAATTVQKVWRGVQTRRQSVTVATASATRVLSDASRNVESNLLAATDASKHALTSVTRVTRSKASVTSR